MRQITIIFTFFLILIIILNNFSLSIAQDSQNEKGDWTTFYCDNQHTGYQKKKGNGNISNYGIVWVRNFDNTWIYGEPVIANVDLIGGKEIIFGNDKGNVYCLDINGNINWKFECSKYPSTILGIRITPPPTLVDILGNETLEIIISCANGKIYCLSCDGTLIWSYQADDIIESSPTVDDLTGNGELDITFLSRDGLYLINNKGELIWKYNLIDAGLSSPAIADINHDGLNDIVVGTDDNASIFAFTTRVEKINNTSFKYYPKRLWAYYTKKMDNMGILGSPVLFDINNDNNYEIIFGASDGMVHCLNNEGKNLWFISTGAKILYTPAVADINSDGKYEIMIGTDVNGEELICFNYKGNIYWRIKYNVCIVPNPVIFDVDGDGYLEITSIDKSRQYSSPDVDRKPFIYSINILNYNGEEIHKLKYITENYDRFNGVAVCDLQSDGKLEILTGTVFGNLYCYGELENTTIKEDNHITNNNKNVNKDMGIYLCPSAVIIFIIIIIIIILRKKIKKFRYNSS